MITSSTNEQSPVGRQSFKERVLDMGITNVLRKVRATVLPHYRRDAIDNQNLRLLLSFVLASDANCIDVGAYRGSLLAEMLRVAPAGKHIAYEPLPFMYEYLKRRYPQVDVRHAAVSNEVGEQEFVHLKQIPGYSGFKSRNLAVGNRQETFSVRTETLDGCLPPDYVPTLIKIDVEGAERQVLEGALNTLTRHSPVVIFEHGKGAAEYYDTRPDDIYTFFDKRVGLRIFDLDGTGPYTLPQFRETFTQNLRWNFVAHL